MKTSCISEPVNQPLIIIKQWQLEITCDKVINEITKNEERKYNHCAAALLSFYKYWHENKLESKSQNNKYNKVKEFHGEEVEDGLGLLQFHTQKELHDGLLHLFGKDKIVSANKLLVQFGFISIHRNPNPRYKFDNTNYFLFHPEIVQDAVDKEYRLPSSENRQRSAEIIQQPSENGRTITETTTETTTESSSLQFSTENISSSKLTLRQIIENKINTWNNFNPDYNQLNQIAIKRIDSGKHRGKDFYFDKNQLDTIFEDCKEYWINRLNNELSNTTDKKLKTYPTKDLSVNPASALGTWMTTKRIYPLDTKPTITTVSNNKTPITWGAYMLNNELLSKYGLEPESNPEFNAKYYLD